MNNVICQLLMAIVSISRISFNTVKFVPLSMYLLLIVFEVNKFIGKRPAPMFATFFLIDFFFYYAASIVEGSENSKLSNVISIILFVTIFEWDKVPTFDKKICSVHIE